MGSIAGLLVAPALIERLGWQSVFYAFGGVGLLWTVWWERLMADFAARGQGVELTRGIEQVDLAQALQPQPGREIPWRSFLRSGPVRALMFTHFCQVSRPRCLPLLPSPPA